jgi:hypothetical protein
MLMIVKGHEKEQSGVSSVTRITGPAACSVSPDAAGRLAIARSGVGEGAEGLVQLAAGRWSLPRPGERKARTFALLVH